MRGMTAVLILAMACGGADPGKDVDADADADTDDDTDVDTDTDGDTDDDTDGDPRLSGCHPVPAPTGPIVDVDPSMDDDTLRQTAAGLSPGDTLRFAAGTYTLGAAGYLRITAPGVTLVGATGDRDDVVLDGQYQTTEVVQILADDVTLAHLTIRRAWDHPVHVMGDGDDGTTGTWIHDIRVVDPGQQAIKVNSGEGTWADDGVISCSSMELTTAGRAEVRDDCYTGGVDTHGGDGWVVRDNRIDGFWCEEGLSEHGVHFWRASRDTVVERNHITNCARGVGFGLSDTPATEPSITAEECPAAGDAYVGHLGGIVRNNTIVADDPALFASGFGFDGGIALAAACDATVVHNTVFSTQAPYASIEWRFDGTSGLVANNLLSHPMRERTPDTATVGANQEDAGAADFVDAAAGDLHLASTSTAVDAGEDLAGDPAPTDLDGQPRADGAPDLGADEI
jgi:hypothetical protein